MDRRGRGSGFTWSIWTARSPTANDNGAILEAVAKLERESAVRGRAAQLDDIAQALERGAARVVLGTIAVQQPEIVAQAIERWGAEAISVALDARDGKVTTHGWQQSTSHDAD